MAEFTCQTGRAADKLLVQNQACANSLGYRDCDQVANAFAVPAEPDLGERAGVCGILQLYGKPGDLLERRLQIEFAPAQVRRKHQPLGTKIDPAGQAYAD